MTSSSGGSSNSRPEPTGTLFGSTEVTLADIYDPKTKSYYLYPEAPLAKELKVLPNQRSGVIDSGVVHQHPQIAGLVVAERDWTGEGVEDLLGHGTAVTLGLVYVKFTDPSMVAMLGDHAEFKNTTPGLVVAKVAPKNGPILLKNVIEAVNWVAEQGVVVVNMSLGFTGEPEQFTELKKAIESHPAVIFVAAAGNYGPNRKVYPAAIGAKNVISVGEVSQGKVAKTSGKGDVYAKTVYKPIPAAQYDEARKQKEQFESALALAREKRFDEANAIFREITKTPGRRDAPGAWYQLALYELSRDQYDAGLADLAEVEKLTGPTAVLLSQRGAAYLLKGDAAKAEKDLLQSIALDNSVASVHFNLGLTYLRVKKLRSALAQFRETSRLQPDYPRLDGILGPMEDEERLGRLPPE
jgi:tetratricopeptide (TPR) repeat protein